MVDFLQEELHDITLDDLLAHDTQRVEIINGEWREMLATGGIHAVIGRNIFRHLDDHVHTTEIGEVFFDGITFLINSSSRQLKHSYIPDVAFVSYEHLPLDWDIFKPFPGVPDLAIEVVSPGDDADDIETKVQTYLRKGTQEVWLAYPSSRIFKQHWLQNDEIQTLTYSKEGLIDTSRLFPTLELRYEQIFYLPEWVKKQLEKQPKKRR